MTCRKCAKCGASSGNLKDVVSFHRFPRTTRSNFERVKKWAQWCYPGEDFSTFESVAVLYKKNKNLCGRHFAKKMVYASGHLSKFAVPTIDAVDPTIGIVSHSGDPDLKSSSDTREPLELDKVRAQTVEESSSDEDGYNPALPTWIVGNISTSETQPTQSIPQDQGHMDYANDFELSTGIDIAKGPETYIKCYTCLDEGVEMKSMECVELVASTIRRQPHQCHLSSLYADVTGLPPPDPSFGAAMCMGCVIRLIDAYIFKLQSIESNAAMKSSATQNNSQSSQISSTGGQASAINNAQKKDIKPQNLELSTMNEVDIPTPETELLNKRVLVEKNETHECHDLTQLSIEKPQKCPKRAQKRRLEQELPTRPLRVAPDIGTDTTHVHNRTKKEEPSRNTAHKTKQADHYVDSSTSGVSTRIPCSKKQTENVPITVKRSAVQIIRTNENI